MTTFLLIMMAIPAVLWVLFGATWDEWIQESGKLILWYGIFGGLYLWIT